MAVAMGEERDLDLSLYSRQLYVIGKGAMARMSAADVLVVGSRSLGCEIAKNIALAGVKSITIVDSQRVDALCLGTNCFATAADIGRPLSEVTAHHVAELNPYVHVVGEVAAVASKPLEWFERFTAVVITHSVPHAVQCTINQHCRSQSPPIAFVSCDIRGAMAWAFVDLGAEFVCAEPLADEPQAVVVTNVTKAKEGVVSCVEHHRHGLENGDVVEFRDVRGMEQLNNTRHSVKVVDSFTFSVGDTSQFGAYTGGGVATQVAVPVTLAFNSLETELQSESPRFVAFADRARQHSLHACVRALDAFEQEHARSPAVWNAQDADHVAQIAARFNPSCDEALVKQVACTCSVVAQGDRVSDGETARSLGLPGVASVMGGVVAQEVVKAVSGKFTPLNQWFFFDGAMSLLPPPSLAGTPEAGAFMPVGGRDDAQLVVLGEAVCDRLHALKLFLVGAGSIGCELLKNIALMNAGVRGHGAEGGVVLTDPDLVELSNLNRQFLFRHADLQQPKAEVAARRAALMNPALRITAFQHRVDSDSEPIFSDAFLRTVECVLPALDSIPARQYLDSRCVACERPMIDSGTVGTKAHVQVVLPHLTEPWSNSSDPPDAEFPICTLRSFPYTPAHTVEWGRDKFEKLFVVQLGDLKSVVDPNTRGESIQRLVDDGQQALLRRISKHIHRLPTTFAHCLVLARAKFQKYFHNDIAQLLHQFPPHLVASDGSQFWKPPKRQPSPLVFSADDEVHIGFVVAFARVLASGLQIPVSKDQMQSSFIAQALEGASFSEFVANADKKIQADEGMNNDADKGESEPLSHNEREAARAVAMELLQDLPRLVPRPSKIQPQRFEKDDDSNFHVQFIGHCANLRARCYGIQESDMLTVKRVAGKIVPAIATTTAVVAGLVSVELTQLCQSLCNRGDEGDKPKHSLGAHKNSFLNLALPFMVHSDPVGVARNELPNGSSWTEWDRWEISEGDCTLQQLVDAFESKYGLEMSGLCHGSHIVYMPLFPSHAQRLPKKVTELLASVPAQGHVDLVVICEDSNGDEVNTPMLRFVFRSGERAV